MSTIKDPIRPSAVVQTATELNTDDALILDRITPGAGQTAGVHRVSFETVKAQIQIEAGGDGGSISGTGSPEGVRTGNAGWTYLDLTGKAIWLKSTNGGALGWLKQSGPFNVRLTGAKIDGSTPDSAAINAAIVLVNAIGGGQVLIPTGTAKINSTINVLAGVTLIGEGRDSTNLAESVVLSPVISLNGNKSGVAGLKVTGIETALTWDSNAATIQGRVGVLINADDCMVENVAVLEKSTGIKANAGSDNATIAQCFADNSWLTTALTNYIFASNIFINGCDRTKVFHCRLSRCAQGVLVGGSSTNGLLDGCSVYDCQNNGIYISSALSWTTNACHVKNVLGGGIKARGFRNIISNCNVDTCGVGPGITISPFNTIPTDQIEIDFGIARGLPASTYYNGRDGVISNCVVSNCQADGIRIDRVTEAFPNGVYFHSAVIEGCTVANCGSTDNAFAMVIYGDDILVKNCTFLKWNAAAGGFAIVCTVPAPVTSFRNIRIEGCVFDSMGVAQNAISFTGVTVGAINHCIIMGAMNSIQLAGCDRINVLFNKMTGNGQANSGRLRLANTVSSNLYVVGNDSDSAANIAIVPTTSFFALNKPSVSALGILQMDTTPQTIGIGPDGPPDVSGFTPLTVGKNGNTVTQIALKNLAPLGAGPANILAGVQLAVFCTDCSGFWGARSSESSTGALAKKVIAGLNSNANALAFWAPFTGQTIDHYAGTGTLTMQETATSLVMGSTITKIDLGGGVGIFWGAGSPEGVVTAAVGSLYLRTNGGAGTAHYAKETGAGNTGWVGK